MTKTPVQNKLEEVRFTQAPGFRVWVCRQPRHCSVPWRAAHRGRSALLTVAQGAERRSGTSPQGRHTFQERRRRPLLQPRPTCPQSPPSALCWGGLQRPQPSPLTLFPLESFCIRALGKPQVQQDRLRCILVLLNRERSQGVTPLRPACGSPLHPSRLDAAAGLTHTRDTGSFRAWTHSARENLRSLLASPPSIRTGAEMAGRGSPTCWAGEGKRGVRKVSAPLDVLQVGQTFIGIKELRDQEGCGHEQNSPTSGKQVLQVLAGTETRSVTVPTHRPSAGIHRALTIFSVLFESQKIQSYLEQTSP